MPRPSDELLRSMPRMDDLLRAGTGPAGVSAAEWADALRRAVDEVRAGLLAGTRDGMPETEAFLARGRELAGRAARPHLRRCINATGVVLHTNLGRAPLAEEAVAAVAEVAAGYCNLEFDLDGGERGDRLAAVERLAAEVCGAPAALVVNNCAGATLLLLDTLGRGREIVVSRGQLVEIGGSYRLPEVFAKAGCRLREVGTTNRTRLSDYASAIGPDTAALMRVHTGNFRVVGFAESVPLAGLAGLARERGLPLIDDAGSGLLNRELCAGLPAELFRDEPVVRESLAAGADAVVFSGDKLLGGPQAGIVVGRAEVVRGARANPLARALRCDKLTLAALEATLRLHRDPAVARAKIPLWRMLTEGEDVVRRRALRACGMLLAAVPGCDPLLTECKSQAGGGSLPGQELESWAMSVGPSASCGSVGDLARRLRSAPVPVIGRVRRARVMLDMRTVADGEVADLVAATAAALR